MKLISILIACLIILYASFIIKYYEDEQTIELYLTNNEQIIDFPRKIISYKLSKDAFLIFPDEEYDKFIFKTPNLVRVIDHNIVGNWKVIKVNKTEFAYCPSNCTKLRIAYSGLLPGNYTLLQSSTILTTGEIIWQKKYDTTINDSGRVVIKNDKSENFFGKMKLVNKENNITYMLPFVEDSMYYSVNNILLPEPIEKNDNWIIVEEENERKIYCPHKNCKTLHLNLSLKPGEYYIKIKTNKDSLPITLTEGKVIKEEIDDSYYYIIKRVLKDNFLELKINNPEGPVYIGEIEAIKAEKVLRTFDFNTHVINPKNENLTLKIDVFNNGTGTLIYSETYPVTEKKNDRLIKLSFNQTGLININVQLLKEKEVIRRNRLWLNITK